MAEDDAAAEAAAATRIAAMSRGRKARGDVKEKKKVKRERDEAITRIQATMRGRQARAFEQKQLEILEGFSSELSTKQVCAGGVRERGGGRTLRLLPCFPVRRPCL